MNRGVVGGFNLPEVCWKKNEAERKQSGIIYQKAIRFILEYSHSIFQFTFNQCYLHLLQRKLFVLQGYSPQKGLKVKTSYLILAYFI